MLKVQSHFLQCVRVWVCTLSYFDVVTWPIFPKYFVLKFMTLDDIVPVFFFFSRISWKCGRSLDRCTHPVLPWQLKRYQILWLQIRMLVDYLGNYLFHCLSFFFFYSPFKSILFLWIYKSSPSVLKNTASLRGERDFTEGLSPLFQFSKRKTLFPARISLTENRLCDYVTNTSN